MVGKCFRKGSYRESRNNLLGRRHQPWGHTEDGQLGVLALLTPKSTACPCPPSPSLAGVCAATAALEILLSRVQSTDSGVQLVGSGAPSTGHRAWAACASALPRRMVAFCGHCDALYTVRLSFYPGESKAQQRSRFSGAFFFLIFFIYCFDILMIIFSLIFPPLVSSCVGSYHGEIGLWV